MKETYWLIQFNALNLDLYVLYILIIMLYVYYYIYIMFIFVDLYVFSLHETNNT